MRSALARLGASRAVILTASTCATSADKGSARAIAACSSARQNKGSRLIEVWCPAIVIERLTGPTNPPGGATTVIEKRPKACGISLPGESR